MWLKAMRTSTAFEVLSLKNPNVLRLSDFYLQGKAI